jgi:hypothetical protein
MKNSGVLTMRHASNNKLSVENEVDWTYTSKRSHSHRKPGPTFEFSRTAEEGKAKDDLEKDSNRSLMEAVRTSETSVDNHFTQQYIPEDNSEQ